MKRNQLGTVILERKGFNSLMVYSSLDSAIDGDYLGDVAFDEESAGWVFIPHPGVKLRKPHLESLIKWMEDDKNGKDE